MTISLPAVAVSALPFGACPVCWPVYAGVLSSLGLGFLMSRAYLLPLTACFLLIAVSMLLIKRNRGYRPFLLGLAAAVLILSGKFSVASDLLAYAGVALLVLASAWNAWPRAAAARCSKCAPSTGGLVQLSAQEKSS